MLNKSILILGARSDIAKAIAYKFAESGYDIQLAARNIKNMSMVKSDIKLRLSVAVSLHEFDVLNLDGYTRFIKSLPQLPNIAVCAIGFMGDQNESEMNLQSATKVMRSNFEGPASIFALLANLFEKRGSGVLVGISSVAGNRGRAKNYVYGSAKAGYTSFLSGLRNRLDKKGIRVISVLPGYVETKMTEGIKLPKLITAHTDEVANSILKEIGGKKDVIYIRSIWRIIMFIICLIPEKIFKKLNI
jgi:short-subunit dehydrogenase